ncbi:MAG: hypothetical protein WBA74_08815 [Cyclobacteriaceae bacterium]
MLNNLKENEIQVATRLINGGLSMAKKSMEQILQSPITIQKIDYSKDSSAPHRYEEATGTNVHLLKTGLMGDLKGSCYLIFTAKEVDKINKACLPKQVLNDDSDQAKMMKMGFLTEIDNMVAAAVITEFSNLLGLELFGMVPSLHIVDAAEVNDYLSTESEQFDTVIHFKAVFHGEELDIMPHFVWMVQKEFMNKIREIS